MSVPGSPSRSEDSGRSEASSFAQRRGWIGIALGLLLLWLAFRKVPISELRSALAGGECVWLVPLAGLELVGFAGRSARWQALLARPGILEDAFWVQSVGFIFTNLLPFGGKYDPRDRTGGNARCLPGLVCPYELPGCVGHVENGGDLRRHRQTAHRLEGALGPTGCGRGGDRWRSSTKWAR